MAERELHVFWKLYSESVPLESVLLSFLTPLEEERFLKLFAGRVFIGRSEMNAIRKKARILYTDLVARVGATPCKGKTLRQTLATSGAGNPWWYHKFTNKDVENDPTFNFILQILAISNIAKREKLKKIVLHGGHGKIGAVLSSIYEVSRRRSYFDWSTNPLKGILSRFKFLCLALRDHIAVSHYVRLPRIEPEVVFQGFWDWSLEFDEYKEKLEDSYFKSLPAELAAKGIQCAWLLWFSPHTKTRSRGQSLSSILKPAQKHQQLIFLQKFLQLTDILSTIADFRALLKYLRFSRYEDFRALFREQGLDFWPLLRGRLIYHFCDSSLASFTLMELSCRRAFAAYQPKVAITFLELFLQSRAFYHGGRLDNSKVIHCTMQHASYSREKMFLVVDPEREYCGKPDRYPIPTPDYIFAMGELGRKIFLENGFPPDRIFLTGSSRYDNIKEITAKRDEKIVNRSLKILLVTTLNNPSLEFEMIQAVSLAATGLGKIKLYIRSHPFARIEDHPGFERYRDLITSTSGTLDEDLDMADLVIFTYSTVAEEAFLRSIPVHQWLSTGFNGSVFSDIKAVPNFSTVSSLRESLIRFSDKPDSFRPTEENKALVARKCFYKTDGQASQRIAARIQTILDQHEKDRFDLK